MSKYLFTLFLLFCATTLFSQRVEKGIIDLSNVDLYSNSVELTGEWEFYWEQLADPPIINRLRKDYYNLPGFWNGGVTTNGKKISSQGYATYRIKVVLPEERPELALTINEMHTAFLMFYNGFEFAGNGIVSTSDYDAKPDWIPQTVNFRPYSDTIEFVLYISNFHHDKGGVREPIILGDRRLLTSKRDFGISYDFLLSGSLIMGGLFFLGLFIFGQHEKSVLYFALFCISFSYRMVGSGEYALHALYPNMPWYLMLRAEYLFLFIPAGIFSIYTHSLYPADSNKNVMIGFSIICTLLSITVLATEPSFFSQITEPFGFLSLLMILYLIYVYWLALRRRRLGSQYAFLSTIIVFIVTIYQIFIYSFSVQENTLFTFIGFILFFFFQSLILSYRFAFSLRKAKEEAETANKAKTDFLSTISHEIRTPLNAVLGISHYLINEKPKPDQVESLESLQFSAEHLSIIINDILDFNKLESGSIVFDFVEVDIKSLSKKIIRSYKPVAEEKNIELNLEFDKEIYPIILADPTRLYQVLNNLISNAIKFTNKGFVKLRLVKLWGDDNFQKIKFQVIDSGIGIPKEKQELIFERFTQAGSSNTREYGGTGLGLAIIKRILTLFESKIELESNVDEGTTFSFELEFKKVYGQKLEVAGPVIEEDNVITGKRILLVEDNRMNIMIAEKFLKKWGMDVDIAMNGEEGVNCAKSKEYHLVLMDLQMPIMDGYVATQNIRNFNPSIPIIALTASALAKVQQEVKEAGMNDYLIKPFDPVELKNKLINYLSEN